MNTSTININLLSFIINLLVNKRDQKNFFLYLPTIII